jgi:hypothetical protein
MVVTNFKTYIEKLNWWNHQRNLCKENSLFCIKVFKSFCVDSLILKKS